MWLHWLKNTRLLIIGAFSASLILVYPILFCFTRVLVVSDQFSLKIHWKLFVSESWCVNFELMGNEERINCRVQHLKTEVQPVFFSSNFVSERLIRLKANLTLRTSTLSIHGLNWIASILELITKIKVTSSRVPSLFSYKRQIPSDHKKIFFWLQYFFVKKVLTTSKRLKSLRAYNCKKKLEEIGLRTIACASSRLAWWEDIFGGDFYAVHPVLFRPSLYFLNLPEFRTAFDLPVCSWKICKWANECKLLPLLSPKKVYAFLHHARTLGHLRFAFH